MVEDGQIKNQILFIEMQIPKPNWEKNNLIVLLYIFFKTLKFWRWVIFVWPFCNLCSIEFTGRNGYGQDWQMVIWIRNHMTVCLTRKWIYTNVRFFCDTQIFLKVRIFSKISSLAILDPPFYLSIDQNNL